MSCMFCIHWAPPHYNWDAKKEDRPAWEDRIGHCTFNPVWLKTGAQHYCGRLVHKDAGEAIDLWKRLGYLNEANEQLRERAKKAEAAAKALRAKLKQQKAGA